LGRIHESSLLTVYRVAEPYRRARLTGGSPAAGETARGIEWSSTSYVIKMPVAKGENELTFRETFASQWRVHPLARAGALAMDAPLPWWKPFFLPELADAAHGRFARYANRWTFDGDRFCAEFGCNGVDGQPRTATLLVEYAPQRYVYLLQLVAGFAGAVFALRALVPAWRRAARPSRLPLSGSRPRRA